MARLLTVAEYGILATLFSIIYLLALFSEPIQTIISKQASNPKNNVAALLKNALKHTTYPAFFFFILYLIISIPLSFFLHIDYLLLSLNGIMIFGSFYMPINRGLLQGRKRFFPLGTNMIIESVMKLVFSLIFVSIGWAVYGSIVGGLIGAGVAYLFSFFSLRPLINQGKDIVRKKISYEYGKESFLTIFALMTFFSIDVVIARLVFDPDVAGAYAISSIIAKTIFFAATPLSKAMFSFTAEKVTSLKAKKVFLNTLGLIGAGIVVALVLFYLFPELWVRIFSGKELPLATQTLFILGVAYSLITLTNVVLLYKISLHQIRSPWIILSMPLIQFFLLLFFSNTLVQFSCALVASSALFLWVALRR